MKTSNEIKIVILHNKCLYGNHTAICGAREFFVEQENTLNVKQIHLSRVIRNNNIILMRCLIDMRTYRRINFINQISSLKNVGKFDHLHWHYSNYNSYDKSWSLDLWNKVHCLKIKRVARLSLYQDTPNILIKCQHAFMLVSQYAHEKSVCL